MRLSRGVGRLTASLSVLVAAALVAVVGAAPHRDSQAATGGTATTHLVVALGDSVPSGAACQCSPFPSLYGALLGQRTGEQVRVENYAVSGLDTSGLLAQLQQERIVESVRRADVFLVTIGANDFEDHHDHVVEGACTTGAVDCVSDEMESMRSNLGKVLAEIRTLRGGSPTTVLVTGYWNVFEDGDVAQQASGASGLKASIQLTLRVNAAISAVASTAGADYVDLFEPFQSHGRDIGSLLAVDGDHPDAAGHQLIARTLLAAGLPRSS